MGGNAENPEDLQRALDRLSDLLLFRERFSEDPRAALERYGLGAIPQEAADALARMSPEELRIFSQVQRKLSDVPVGDEIGIFF